MARTETRCSALTARGGVLTAEGLVARAAERRSDARARNFPRASPKWLYSEAGSASALGRLLIEKRLPSPSPNRARAGLVAEKLDARARGISAVFERGFVTYSDRSKTEPPRRRSSSSARRAPCPRGRGGDGERRGGARGRASPSP
jgi:hypothetical protein